MPQNANDFLASIPWVTKHIIISSLLLTILCSFNVIPPMDLIYFPDRIFSKELQLWRIFTGLLFFGPFGLPFLFNFMFLFNYSKRVEEDVFSGRTADYIFMLLFGGILICIAGYFLNLYFISQCLLSLLVYVWCNRHADSRLTLMLINVEVKAIYFPWALLAFHLLLGGQIFLDIVGIVIGHLYCFLMYDYPTIYGSTVLKTPQFLYRIFPPVGVNVNVLGNQQLNQNQRVQMPVGGHQWGRGRTLR